MASKKRTNKNQNLCEMEKKMIKEQQMAFIWLKWEGQESVSPEAFKSTYLLPWITQST